MGLCKGKKRGVDEVLRNRQIENERKRRKINNHGIGKM